ncbi:hypothetical protein MnTg01_00620 [archaeon MnTg01]|nr:hypothetical protein MnTg01_00620 [archaeon MnTg01]
MLVEEVSTPGSITEDSDTSVFPIAICLPESVRAFQFIPGFGLSVFIPNFTISPDFNEVEVVKIITPWGVFSPVHPRSVLKDLKLKSLPNHIRKVSISDVLSLF